MKDRIYIAGPMTGIQNDNYPAFVEAAKQLRKAGWDAVSPTELGFCRTHREFMAQDITALFTCDSIVLLPGWEDSRGARAEVFLAISLRMDIYRWPDMFPLEENDVYNLLKGRLFK